MSTNKRELNDLISRIIARETKYLKCYVGKVLSTEDDQNRGRVLVEIPGLGLTGQDKAAWCWPRDKHSLSVAAVGEQVEVNFINGDPNYPRYQGIAAEIQDMIPRSYTGDPGTHVLFEDPTHKVHVSYDANKDELTIGNQNHQPCARKGDATTSGMTEDSTFWTWLAAAAAVLVGLGVVVPIPTSLSGKVNAGSGQVKVGDA